LRTGKHKVPLKLRFFIAKDRKLLRSIDRLVAYLKPPRKYKGKLQKILFIRNDRIGDAMVTLPVLRDIKLNYSQIQLHVLSSKRNNFVFDGLEFLDRVQVLEPHYMRQDVSGIYKVLLIGDLLMTLKLFIFPYLSDKEFRNKIRKLKEERYNAVVDFTGEKFNLILSKILAKYTIGSWVFGLFWLYSYYVKSNWVSHFDRGFMTRKIEECLTDALGFQLKLRDTSTVLKQQSDRNAEKKIDILIHLGSSELRKLPLDIEEDLIEKLSVYKLIITDSEYTRRFALYEKKYKGTGNVEMKLYKTLKHIAEDAPAAKLFLCYDGGQALYLSQFLRTIAIYGPGSVYLWKPYEFEDYAVLKEWDGVKAIQSKGKFGHIAIYSPIWCSPCYEIGCKTRPCLSNIKSDHVLQVVNQALTMGSSG
jgi:ADP-heptose:LPS heptosyltransferase